MFFPEKGEFQNVNKALKKYCINCEVRKECRDYWFRTGADGGVWGGELQQRNDGKPNRLKGE